MAIVSSSLNIVVLWIMVIICLSSCRLAVSGWPPPARVRKFPLPAGVTGPGSVIRGLNGAPYITVADGRVLRWDFDRDWVDFGQTATNRTKELCDGNTNQDLWPICGRPLGMDYDGGDVYIVDPYFGLMKLNFFSGGNATLVADSVEGQPFRFLTDVLIFGDKIYFTDASQNYEPRNASEGMEAGDTTGRLLEYDTKTNQVTVLLRNLSWPVGVGGFGNSTHSFIFISEYTANRLRRYEPSSGTDTALAPFNGKPTGMYFETGFREFFVAVNFEDDQTPPTISPAAVRITLEGVDTGHRDLSTADAFFNHSVSDIATFSAQGAAPGMFIVSPTTNFIGLYDT